MISVWMNILLPLLRLLLAALLSAVAAAQVTSSVPTLPGVIVSAPTVANLSPAGTFAAPVTALRYEPRVDVQGRNLAEAQADITLRGGTFENTGFRLGALSIVDPQTGHYLAELPLAPAMLGAPRVLAGAEASLGVGNATAGAIAQDWRAVTDGGWASAGAGQFALRRAEVFVGAVTRGGLGADVGVARSRADGSVNNGDHDFSRATVRLQARSAGAQTDAALGYQEKRFGWPNLYTPFGSAESENLQTLLLALNHRAAAGGDATWEAGAFHRRNKDDYAFNRFAPLGPVHPFQHTTWVTGGAAEARWRRADWTVSARGEAQADRITSTSLTFGRYRSRVLTKAAAAAAREWTSEVGRGMLRLGVAHDDSNRDGGRWLPVAEAGRDFTTGVIRSLRLGYAETSQLPSYTALNASPSAGLFRGNAGLGRSVSRNLELAAVANAAGWSIEAVAFTRRDDALVDWTFRRGVTARAANAVDVRVSGLEWVARRSWSRCDVVLGHTWLGKGADYGGAAVDASFYALNHARHRITGALTARLTPRIDLRLDNSLRWQAPNLLRVTGGDRALHTSVGLHFRPEAIRGLELAAHLDNAWDDDFQDVPAVPAARRQLSFSVARLW